MIASSCLRSIVNGVIVAIISILINVLLCSTLPGVDPASYAYDANDRLTNEATYDANGNTLLSPDPLSGAVVSDAYEFRDRLKSRDAGAVDFVYNGDGLRVGKRFGSGPNAGLEVNYLVDDLNPTGYPQVFATETSGDLFRIGVLAETLSVEPVTSPANIVQIVDGDGHTIVRTSDDLAFTWGINNYGQLGRDGDPALPEAVPTLTGIISVAAGHLHSLALDDQGTVYAFGDDSFGQCAGENQLPVTEPLPVALPVEAVQVKAAASTSYAVGNDGKVYAWGANDFGQLGDGTTLASPEPYPVDGIANIVDLHAGNGFAIAIDADGNAYAWGRNDVGQLGDGSTVNRTAPVAINIGSAVVSLSVSDGVNYAETVDGLVSWGAGILQPVAETEPELINAIQRVATGSFADSDTWIEARYFFDAMGNVRGAVDPQGQVISTVEYDAFGNGLAATGYLPNRLYRGEEFDSDLGMYYLRARYYNPDTGRFHTPDPFDGFTRDPYSLHKYHYANNNPVTYQDPSGNFAVFNIGTAYMALYLADLYSEIIHTRYRELVSAGNHYEALAGLGLAGPSSVLDYFAAFGREDLWKQRTRRGWMIGDENLAIGSLIASSSIHSPRETQTGALHYSSAYLGDDTFFYNAPKRHAAQGKAEMAVEQATSMVYNLRTSLNTGLRDVNALTGTGMRSVWGDIGYYNAFLKASVHGSDAGPIQLEIYQSPHIAGGVRPANRFAGVYHEGNMLGMATRFLNPQAGGDILNQVLKNPDGGHFGLAQNINLFPEREPNLADFIDYNSVIGFFAGVKSWQQYEALNDPTLSASERLELVESYERDLFLIQNAGVIATVGASFIPGVGESMDIAIIANPHEAAWVRTLAGVSLGVSAHFGGLTPNFGAMIKKVREAATLGDIIPQTAKRASNAFEAAQNVTIRTAREVGDAVRVRTEQVADYTLRTLAEEAINLQIGATRITGLPPHPTLGVIGDVPPTRISLKTTDVAPTPKPAIADDTVGGKTADDALRDAVRSKYENVMSSRLSRRERGPVVSGVMYKNDPSTIRIARNHPNKALPSNLHPVLKERYMRLQNLAQKRGVDPIVALGKDVAGMHSEIWAANDLLWSLGNNLPSSVLNDLTFHNLRLIKYGKALPGASIIRCPNCRFLTRGARYIE